MPVNPMNTVVEAAGRFATSLNERKRDRHVPPSTTQLPPPRFHVVESRRRERWSANDYGDDLAGSDVNGATAWNRKDVFWPVTRSPGVSEHTIRRKPRRPRRSYSGTVPTWRTFQRVKQVRLLSAGSVPSRVITDTLNDIRALTRALKDVYKQRGGQASGRQDERKTEGWT